MKIVVFGGLGMQGGTARHRRFMVTRLDPQLQYPDGEKDMVAEDNVLSESTATAQDL